MTAILPQGLINATSPAEQILSDDTELDVSNSEILRKFWKGPCVFRLILLAIADGNV